MQSKEYKHNYYINNKDKFVSKNIKAKKIDFRKEEERSEKLREVKTSYINADIVREFKHSKNRIIIEEYNIQLRLAEEKWKKLYRQLVKDKKLGNLL